MDLARLLLAVVGKQELGQSVLEAGIQGTAQCCREEPGGAEPPAAPGNRPVPLRLHRYSIMQACWSLEPTRRPTFDQIVCLVQKELEVHKEQVRTFGEQGDVLPPP